MIGLLSRIVEERTRRGVCLEEHVQIMERGSAGTQGTTKE